MKKRLSIFEIMRNINPFGKGKTAPEPNPNGLRRSQTLSSPQSKFLFKNLIGKERKTPKAGNTPELSTKAVEKIKVYQEMLKKFTAKHTALTHNPSHLDKKKRQIYYFLSELYGKKGFEVAINKIIKQINDELQKEVDEAISNLNQFISKIEGKEVDLNTGIEIFNRQIQVEITESLISQIFKDLIIKEAKFQSKEINENFMKTIDEEIVRINKLIENKARAVEEEPAALIPDLR